MTFINNCTSLISSYIYPPTPKGHSKCSFGLNPLNFNLMNCYVKFVLLEWTNYFVCHCLFFSCFPPKYLMARSKGKGHFRVFLWFELFFIASRMVVTFFFSSCNSRLQKFDFIEMRLYNCKWSCDCYSKLYIHIKPETEII